MWHFTSYLVSLCIEQQLINFHCLSNFPRRIMSPINPHLGFWGKPTSTLDWCERNYEVSFELVAFSNSYQTDKHVKMSDNTIYGICMLFQLKYELLILCLLTLFFFFENSAEWVLKCHLICLCKDYDVFL